MRSNTALAAAAEEDLKKPPPIADTRLQSLMPTWWLALQQSYWWTQFLTGGLLINILLPFRVLKLVGNAEKAKYLATINTIGNIVSITSVFWGAASDATRSRKHPLQIVLGSIMHWNVLDIF